jgi:hypothetical protein
MSSLVPDSRPTVVTVSCSGLSDAEGSAAVADVAEEFAGRPWQRDVRCEWVDGTLRLTATSDNDFNEALLDEFWDAVIACVATENTIRFRVEAVS